MNAAAEKPLMSPVKVILEKGQLLVVASSIKRRTSTPNLNEWPWRIRLTLSTN